MIAKINFNSIKGFTVSAVKAGIKTSGKPDLGMILCDGLASTAGVFTKNAIVSPSVTLCKSHLKKTKGKISALLVNAGNANACTGPQGLKNAKDNCKQVASLVGAKMSEVLVCSTGIIGHQLDMKKMTAGINKAYAVQGKRCEKFIDAILTTDLVAKEASTQVRGVGNIAGVCKGSGMIAPNMATMLAFIVTDADITPTVLQKALRDVVSTTFNCVTVDSDCSTNDSVIVMASGASGKAKITKASGKNYQAFVTGLRKVCLSLSEQIAADGEGATKLVRVCVKGAKSKADAEKVARSIADSPLFKTAMFGCDPNWGRILMAAGKCGAQIKEEKINLKLCGVTLFKKSPQKFSEKKVSKLMKAKEIEVLLDLGLGKHSATMLTCDFSYDYVKINAEYHT